MKFTEAQIKDLEKLFTQIAFNDRVNIWNCSELQKSDPPVEEKSWDDCKMVAPKGEFKAEQTFPIIFEDDKRRIRVLEDGRIIINDKIHKWNVSFINKDSLDLLYKAVECSNKLRGKKNE